MVKTDRFEAVLLADVRIRDVGVGHQMKLVFEDKTILRVRASPAVLRMRLPRTGLHRVTLSLRSRPTGEVREPMYLTQVEPIDTPIQTDTRTLWSVRGLVATEPRSIVVFPTPARTFLTPFRVYFRSALMAEAAMDIGGSVHAHCVLQNGVLQATSIDEIGSIVLSKRQLRWRRWFSVHSNGHKSSARPITGDC